MVGSIINDIISGFLGGLLLSIVLFIATICTVKHNVNSGYEKRNIYKQISFFGAFRSIIRTFVSDKIDDDLYAEDVSNEHLGMKNSFIIKSIAADDIENIEETELLKKKSKNYGENNEFSIRTWYGINYKILQEKKYVLFTIKEESEQICIRQEDIMRIIDKEINKSEKEKYIERNSFDTYLVKSKQDNHWYITRLGANLDKAIRIV